MGGPFWADSRGGRLRKSAHFGRTGVAEVGEGAIGGLLPCFPCIVVLCLVYKK